jgi:CMP-N-acetylneuraminic acid synthetase
MFNGKKILAIITARGGSKRLPNKNVLPLSDKPLIQWSIESALESKYVDTCIVSTDSTKIAEISKNAGAAVPFIRPLELANDTASSFDVIVHAMNNCESHDYILLLQPTSPLRTAIDIDNAIEAITKNVKAVVSVCETEHSPLWANTLPKDLSMRDFIRPEIKNKRSQDLDTYYRLNGAIYIGEPGYFKKNKGFFGHETVASIMTTENSIDIDTQLDFDFANFILQSKQPTSQNS